MSRGFTKSLQINFQQFFFVSFLFHSLDNTKKIKYNRYGQNFTENEVFFMKACIIQPPYSRDVSYSDEYFAYKINLLDECDESVDLIVLPEYSDVPCATEDLEQTLFYHKKYIDTFG